MGIGVGEEELGLGVGRLDGDNVGDDDTVGEALGKISGVGLCDMVGDADGLADGDFF